MKSYTDLEQSKKLAEVISPESADYCWGLDVETLHYNNSPYPCAWKDYTCKEYYIPCWSLAALFNVMPQISEWITPHGHKNDKLSQFEPKICKIWEDSIVPSYKVTYGNELSTDIYDNPVDACVAMIEKLHKLKIL